LVQFSVFELLNRPQFCSVRFLCHLWANRGFKAKLSDRLNSSQQVQTYAYLMNMSKSFPAGS